MIGRIVHDGGMRVTGEVMAPAAATTTTRRRRGAPTATPAASLASAVAPDQPGVRSCARTHSLDHDRARCTRRRDARDRGGDGGGGGRDDDEDEEGGSDVDAGGKPGKRRGSRPARCACVRAHTFARS